MLAQDYLAHRLVELKPAEEWNHSGDGLHLVLTQEGEGEFWASTRRPVHFLSAGDLVAQNGLLRGGLRAANGSLFSFHHFTARFEHLICLFAARESSLLKSLMESFQVARYYPASTALARQCQEMLKGIPTQVSLQQRCQLLKIVSAVLAAELEAMPAQQAVQVCAEDHFVQVLEALTPAELVSLSVPALARRFSCSRRHLNRLFHRHLGTSASTFRMEMRLLKAIALLQNPESKIINVAEECGFNHLGLFNARFKRRFGTTPGRWRQQTLLDQQPKVGAGMHKLKPRPTRAIRSNKKTGGNGDELEAFHMEDASIEQATPLQIIARKLHKLATENRGVRGFPSGLHEIGH